MRLPLAAMFCLLAPAAAPAHEFWLEPAETTSGSIEVRAFVGAEMAGEELANFPTMQRTVDLYVGGKPEKLQGRMGDKPAFQFDPATDGLHVLRYESAGSLLTYDSYDKYLAFLDEAQQPQLAAVHDSMGLSRDGIKEAFYRYAKALIAVGPGVGEDVFTGMTLELVAAENPYQRDGDSVTFQLLLSGNPLPEAAMHVFIRDAGGNVSTLRLRSAAEGLVEVPVVQDGFYVVNAIQIFPATPEVNRASGANWISLWASSSFTVR